jgi:hypothetical protein
MRLFHFHTLHIFPIRSQLFIYSRTFHVIVFYFNVLTELNLTHTHTFMDVWLQYMMLPLQIMKSVSGFSSEFSHVEKFIARQFFIIHCEREIYNETLL